jgi:hypothetical protein
VPSIHARKAFLPLVVVAFAAGWNVPSPAGGACCYFSAKNADVLQPGQKVFITWDAKEKVEAFTVQPKFEGNALDFGMVIPTPSIPKLDEMPRDFFKELAIYTILKQRQYPHSEFLDRYDPRQRTKDKGKNQQSNNKNGNDQDPRKKRKSTVEEIASGVVGSLDYKILKAGRADDLYAWLKKHKYRYAGDEATLNFYVKKKWIFTVMKIDTMQMKKNKDGTYSGEVTPTRFQFFYVQTSYKVDLPGDMTYQYQWVPMIQNAQGWYAKGIFGSNDLPGKADDWLKAIKGEIPDLLRKGQELGFNFVSGQRPMPNKKGHIATTLEWAKRLTEADIKILKGDGVYSETVPNPDEGFKDADFKTAKKRNAALKVIRDRLAKYRKERPGGYLVREAPKEDVKQLKLLAGHLKEGQFLTKFRKTFAKDEMNEDLLVVRANLGQAEDKSEYEEILPTSPP